MVDRLLTRRHLLTGALACTVLGGLSACTEDSTSPAGATATPRPSRDRLTADLLISDKEWLLGRYAVVSARHRGLTADLSAFVRRHEEHLIALGASIDVAASPTAGAPSGPTRSAPADPAAAVGELADAEAAAGRRRTLLVASAGSGRLAAIIASIGACETAHAVLLRELAA